MAYQVQPLREFLVRPALPEPLKRLSELAHNLIWTWDHTVRAVFRHLDQPLWRECGNNPVLMLGRLPQERLERAASDPRFLGAYRRACERLDAYLQQRSSAAGQPLIAYFSMEYGLTECLPIYSGGLGILSGDHLKACSDADVSLIGIGLLYQKGYHQQYLNPDGWQLERYPINDFYTLPLKPVVVDGRELKVSVKLRDSCVWIKVWSIDVGRVKLYLLDTNIPDNARPEDRDITDSLYGGEIDTRIRQEIVLGTGGMRMLKALGIEPTVFHMNEGHSAFLAVERIRVLMQEQGLSFEEALEATRGSNVFTTHTSVPAGIDLFDAGLLFEYFHDYCREANIGFDQFLALGRRNPADVHERFSMAILALKTSAWRNAVSKLHRTVSQEMWSPLWPELPVNEVPITSITNGVHLLSWLNGDLAMLYDQYLVPDWRERYSEPRTWDAIRELPDHELWEVHRRRKRRLIAFIRERVARAAAARKASAAEIRKLSDVLDPEALTIGFARRFATYKRATLLFRDVNRLRKLLTNPDYPVQVIISGKAHPKDHPGKTLIRDIVQLSRDPALTKRLVFVEDYGIEVARELVQGVDLWLNTPRRGEEACGTSGMKAGINGVLNLSILDGWFDEGYEISGGWAIGDREPYTQDQDEYHAAAIYSLLENEIVPLYFSGGEDGYPAQWVQRMKQSLMGISLQFNSQRMIGEYLTELYQPAHEDWIGMKERGFELARQKTRWNQRVQQAWPNVRFVEISGMPEAGVVSGTSIQFEAVVDLAGLAPEDVRVEAVVGRIGTAGHLEEMEVLTLTPLEQKGSAWRFETAYVPRQTGRLGYALRVCSNHQQNPLNRPWNALLKWGHLGESSGAV